MKELYHPRTLAGIYKDYAPRLQRVLWSITGSDADTQDCLQETFIRAHQALSTFDGRSSLWTWLKRIAINEGLRLVTRRARYLGVSNLEDLTHTLADARELGPDLIVCRATMRRLVRQQVEALPERHRDVLRLRDLDELNTRETAERLGISEGAVKVRLHRARVALQPGLRGVPRTCAG